MSKVIGTFIRDKRKAIGMNQKELAAKLEYANPCSISNIELGFNRLPFEKTDKLAEALKLSNESICNIIRTNDSRVKTLVEFGLIPVSTTFPPKVIDDKTQLFEFKGHQLTTIIDDKGNPWWIAKEICDILGLDNVSKAVSTLDDDEKASITVSDTSSSTRKSVPVLAINEPGLYRLIFNSRKPQAVAFRRWVYHNVLPTIRETGKYEASSSVVPAIYDDVTGTQKKFFEKMTTTLSLAAKKFDKDFEKKSRRLVEDCNRAKDNESFAKTKIKFQKNKIDEMGDEIGRLQDEIKCLKSESKEKKLPILEKENEALRKTIHMWEKEFGEYPPLPITGEEISLAKAAKRFGVKTSKFKTFLKAKKYLTPSEKIATHVKSMELFKNFAGATRGGSKNNWYLTPVGYLHFKILHDMGEF